MVSYCLLSWAGQRAPIYLHRAEYYHRVYVCAVRPEALLSSLHAAVVLSRIWRVHAGVLFAQLGGPTSPRLSPVHGVPFAGLPNRPTRAASLKSGQGSWRVLKLWGLLARGGVVPKTKRRQKTHACCAGPYGWQFPMFRPAATTEEGGGLAAQSQSALRSGLVAPAWRPVPCI